MITYAQACRDPHLFGPWFDADSWGTWRVLDKALFGEPLTDAELAIFRELTGREEAPTEAAKEAWIIAGRRAGKDVKAASIAVYLATIGAEIFGYRKRLTGGERAVVQILAVDRDQAQVAFRYCRAFFEQPILAKLLRRETADSLELTNNLAIEITTSDKRRVRGRTVAAAIFDEVAHWRSEITSNPDVEIYRAVKPAMITIPNAMLIGISSPHGRAGLLWEKYSKNYGVPGDALVVKAPTWVLNPTLPRYSGEVASAYESDPAWAAAEYGGEFRTDVEAFVSHEILDACTDTGVHERPHAQSCRYIGFVDASAGSSDSFAMAIAHVEQGGIVMLDVLKESRPPFSPMEVTEQFSETFKAYGIRSVTGDRFGGEWVREQFERCGIGLEPSEQNKSELYGGLLSLLNSRTAALLDNSVLRRQLLSLERKTTRGGRDVVDHVRGAHDDMANACAGALVMAQQAGASTSASKYGKELPSMTSLYGAVA